MKDHGQLKKKETQCPLCRSKDYRLFFEDKNRSYMACPCCRLVFVPEPYRLSKTQEKKEYDLHRNDPDDPHYRRFLSRLANPLLKELAPNQNGLDFGCGPGPALAAMMEEAGHKMDLFDPFYYNRPALLSNEYDFICATEVVEHLGNPHTEFNTLFSMLKPGGRLGIMTKMVVDREAFSRWHYIRDMTHICFYSRPTFEYLAREFNADLAFVGNDVILMTRK